VTVSTVLSAEVMFAFCDVRFSPYVRNSFLSLCWRRWQRKGTQRPV
jgi:hypothetical protein